MTSSKSEKTTAKTAIKSAVLAKAFYEGDHYPACDSLGYLLKRAVSSIRAEADARLASHDLTSSRWAPLLVLSLRGSMSSQAMARELDVDPAAITRVLDHLEAREFVSRDRSSEDRRVVQVALTPTGSKAAKRLKGVIAEVFNDHLIGFTGDEWLLLLSLLRRLVANGEACAAKRSVAETTPKEAKK